MSFAELRAYERWMRKQLGQDPGGPEVIGDGEGGSF